MTNLFFINNSTSILEIKEKLESKCSFVLLLLGSWAILSLITLKNRYLRGHNHNYHLCISLNRLHFHSTHSWLWFKPVVWCWSVYEEIYCNAEAKSFSTFVCNVRIDHGKGRELEAQVQMYLYLWEKQLVYYIHHACPFSRHTLFSFSLQYYSQDEAPFPLFYHPICKCLLLLIPVLILL